MIVHYLILGIYHWALAHWGLLLLVLDLTLLDLGIIWLFHWVLTRVQTCCTIPQSHLCQVMGWCLAFGANLTPLRMVFGSVYATCLGILWNVLLSDFAWNEKAPSKHPIPLNTSLNTLTPCSVSCLSKENTVLCIYAYLLLLCTSIKTWESICVHAHIYSGGAPYQTISIMLIGCSNYDILGALLYVCPLLLV